MGEIKIFGQKEEKGLDIRKGFNPGADVSKGISKSDLPREDQRVYGTESAVNLMTAVPPQQNPNLAYSQLPPGEREKLFAPPEIAPGEVAVAGTVQIDPNAGEMKRDRVALRRPVKKPYGEQ